MKYQLDQKGRQSTRLHWTNFLLIALIIILIALTFPRQHYVEFKYKINDIIHESVIAPFDFPILKTDAELKQDRDEVLRQVPMVFLQKTSITEDRLRQFDAFFSDLEKIKTARKKYNDSRSLLQRYLYSRRYAEIETIVKTDSLNYFTLLTDFQNTFKLDPNSRVINALINPSPQQSLIYEPSFFLAKLRRLLSDLFAKLILDIPYESIISAKIAIQNNNVETLEDPQQVLTLETAWTKAKLSLQSDFSQQNPEFINTCYDILVYFLTPNLIHQQELTLSRQQEAVKKVPISRGIVLENEKIVDANTKITPEIYRKLESLSRERVRRADIKGGIYRNLPVIGNPFILLGQIVIVTIIFSFFLTFLRAYRPAIICNNRLLLLIGIIFVTEIILTGLFTHKFGISQYAVPVTIAAITLTILFDIRIAFVGMATLSILAGVHIGGNLNFIVTSIFASSFAIFSVRKLRKRSQMFQAILYILTGYLLAIVATEMLKYSNLHEILYHLQFALINSAISPFLAYGLIGLLEVAFGITTDLTLLELADFNHPLLKLLSREATGTFTHSVTVGNLAEAAADAIGANALLARVGAYYHDIGKISKPEYFIENQAFEENRHDNLAPNLSVLIIVNHVKEGMRLATEYKLPKAIIDFIPTHHGTTRVEYFYNRALQQAAGPSDINESDYRYPGPTPMTKETGILMICESIEAATRSLKQPTITAIERIIDQVIDKKLKEHQLDECPLTFADLKRIKGNLKDNTGILPVLRGIHHVRVEYPDQTPTRKTNRTNSATS